MAAKFAITRIHCSIDGHFAAKISGVCTKQSCEIAKLIDGCGNSAAKIRSKPSRRACRKHSFSTQGELVCLLFDVDLLELNPPVVQCCPDHDCLCRAIAPCKPGHFAPQRRRHSVQLSEVSAESEISRVEQAADTIGEPKCFGSLLERDVGGTSRDFPVGMLSSPFMRDVPANFSAERVRVELQTNSLISKAGKVRRRRLQIETAREIESRNGQVISFPMCRTV